MLAGYMPIPIDVTSAKCRLPPLPLRESRITQRKRSLFIDRLGVQLVQPVVRVAGLVSDRFFSEAVYRTRCHKGRVPVAGIAASAVPSTLCMPFRRPTVTEGAIPFAIPPLPMSLGDEAVGARL